MIAFPKIAGGFDPLTDAPTPVDRPQLDELGLAARSPQAARPGGERCVLTAAAPDELRPVTFDVDFIRSAKGSVLVTQGGTRVICTAIGRGVRARLDARAAARAG